MKRHHCIKSNILLSHCQYLNDLNIKFGKLDLPTMYWLPKLHKNPYKSRFIANSSNCSTNTLSKHLTSALTAVKDHIVKYCDVAFRSSNINYFWSIKNSGEVIDKIKLNLNVGQVINCSQYIKNKPNVKKYVFCNEVCR